MKASLAVLSAVGAVSAFPSFQLDPRQDDNGVRTDPLVPGISKNNHTCALSEAAESCTDGVSPETVDSCCVETYGGLGVMTQFWSTHTGLEDEGQLLPGKTWTIHGLWPDFCNGSYTGYCDFSRQYDPEPGPSETEDGIEIPPWTGPGISQTIKDFGRYDLLEYMEENWVSQGNPNEVLWAHEYAKHATCFSTFQTECYGPKFVEDEDVIDYFEANVASQERLPTYEWLADAGIVPSNSTGYTYSDIEKALTAAYGAIPYVGCGGPAFNETEAGAGSDDDGQTRLYEAWYFRHFYGRPQAVDYVPVDAKTSSRCATSEGAINYYEIAPGSLRQD